MLLSLLFRPAGEGPALSRFGCGFCRLRPLLQNYRHVCVDLLWLGLDGLGHIFGEWTRRETRPKGTSVGAWRVRFLWCIRGLLPRPFPHQSKATAASTPSRILRRTPWTAQRIGFTGRRFCILPWEWHDPCYCVALLVAATLRYSCVGSAGRDLFQKLAPGDAAVG